MNAALAGLAVGRPDELPAAPDEPDDPGRRDGDRARWHPFGGRRSQAVLDAEIWNPDGTWTAVAAMAEARMYHSSAVLLDDGRVVIAGGEAAGRLRAQIYSPPYLFQGPRPDDLDRARRAGYGASFSVTSPDAASSPPWRSSARQPRRTRSTRTSATCRSFSTNGSTLTVTAPANGNVAPPGYYLLVIKNGERRPIGRPARQDRLGRRPPAGHDPGHRDGCGHEPARGRDHGLHAGRRAGHHRRGRGTYTLSGVSAGDHQLTFSGAPYATVTRSQTVTAGGTFTVDVALALPGDVSGHVTDATTNAPIAGATVTFPGGSTTTDAAGAYAITGLPAGSQPLSAAAIGYVSGTADTTVLAGTSVTQDFSLTRSATYITGEVRDALTTNTIAGATVETTVSGNQVSVLTDSLGRYRIDVPPGTYQVTASASGYPPITEQVIVTAGAYGSMDFNLLRTGATKVVSAAADAYVKGTSTTKNYGTDTTLRMRNASGGSAYTSYLKFNVTGLLGRPVTGAQLRLFTTDPSPDGGHVFVAGNGWTETGITWANAPAPGASQVGAFGAVSTGVWAELDLAPSLIPGDGTYTFAVNSQSSNSAYYSSREGASPPELDLILGSGSPPPPTAGFTASPTSGSAPLTVTFADASTGGPTAWAWDFGDGSTSTSQFPAPHVYATAATYTVSLVASNANGPSAPATKTITVTSGSPPPPTAGFTASPTSGSAPLTVTFADASTGGPTAWAWDFGDGSTSTSQFPAPHVYATAATYTVSLVASNANGPSAPATKTITVTSGSPPPGSRVKTMTFESTSLTDPLTGADSVTGALVRETGSPIMGAGSVRVPNLSSGYLQETFTAAADAYVAFDLRLAARPTGTVRIVFFSDQGTTVGNIQLLSTGALRLRSGSTTVGPDSAPLAAGTVYRVGLHQRKGTGANGLLEAFLAPAGTAFGSPFAGQATGTWTTSADRMRFGATSGSAVDLTADNVAVDVGAMPGPSVALGGGSVTLVATTVDGQSSIGVMFDCMIPLPTLTLTTVSSAPADGPVGRTAGPARAARAT